MSADLHIHICSTKEQIKNVKQAKRARGYCSPANGKGYNFYMRFKIRNKWIHEDDLGRYKIKEGTIQARREIKVKYNENKYLNAKSVWVGSVSWLKAGLTGDKDTYVPKMVEKIAGIIGQGIILDDKVLNKFEKAFSLPNNTVKKDGVWDGKGYKLADKETVMAFLRKNKNKYAYQISW
jgi:hypothetical protein